MSVKPKVRYEPRKEIIIHEYTKFESPEEFIDHMVTGMPAGSAVTLRWVDSILMAFNAFPQNEVTTQELLEGRVHWNHVNFAYMPEHKEQIITKTGVTVSIGNVSTNPSFKAVAEYLKENFYNATKE